MKYEIFLNPKDNQCWQVKLGNEVLKLCWNSKGAALAGVKVEIRRREIKSKFKKII